MTHSERPNAFRAFLAVLSRGTLTGHLRSRLRRLEAECPLVRHPAPVQFEIVDGQVEETENPDFHTFTQIFDDPAGVPLGSPDDPRAVEQQWIHASRKAERENFAREVGEAEQRVHALNADLFETREQVDDLQRSLAQKIADGTVTLERDQNRSQEQKGRPVLPRDAQRAKRFLRITG